MQAITPAPVRSYLQRAFGADLGAAQVALRTLAEAHSPEELADQAYGLYVEFRCESMLHARSPTCRDSLCMTSWEPILGSWLASKSVPTAMGTVLV